MHRSVLGRGAQNNSLEAGAGLCVSDFENPYVRQSAAARLRDVNAGRQARLTTCCGEAQGASETTHPRLNGMRRKRTRARGTAFIEFV